MDTIIDIYNKPEYWCGEIGYHPPGYTDFTVNSIKEISVLTRLPQSILDLGCAYGFAVARFRHIGYEAYGVDISDLAISRANEEVKPYLKVAPLWDLPFADNSIDFGFSSGVLEHIPDDKLTQTVREITRVCNRGLLGIAVTDDTTSLVNEDKSHSTLQSLKYWKTLFPPTFDIISDSEARWRIDATMMVNNMVKLFRRK